MILYSRAAYYAAETFLNLAQPFMGNLYDNIRVLGTRSEKWKPEFLRKIPMDQLPSHYGGVRLGKSVHRAFSDSTLFPKLLFPIKLFIKRS